MATGCQSLDRQDFAVCSSFTFTLFLLVLFFLFLPSLRPRTISLSPTSHLIQIVTPVSSTMWSISMRNLWRLCCLFLRWNSIPLSSPLPLPILSLLYLLLSPRLSMVLLPLLPLVFLLFQCFFDSWKMLGLSIWQFM